MDSTQYETLKNRITDYLKKNLKETRYRHTINVARIAVKMAGEYGADIRKAELAALLHDMARNISIPEMNMYIEDMGFPVRYMDNMNLAHSKIASVLAGTLFGIHDEDVLNAVSFHTTGRAGMSLLEKIIFLADAIEPDRDYPGVDEIRKQAEGSIDKACLMSLKGTVDHIEKQGIYMDPDTLEAKDYFEQMEEI